MAGGLYAHAYVFLHPSSFDFIKSFDPLLIVVLGGLGSLSGTIIAGAAWVGVLETLRMVLPADVLEWRYVIYPVVLIIMMLSRPQGLFGTSEFDIFKPKRTAAPARVAATTTSGAETDGAHS